nr:MAG TPA: hypothetical protein [Caudoviricetes sp.]
MISELFYVEGNKKRAYALFLSSSNSVPFLLYVSLP